MSDEEIERRGWAMIVAASENDVIGVDGDLPWRLSADLKRFKELTMGHAIIMGRRTYESIGRLLPGRTTVIVTRNPEYSVEGAKVVHSLEQAAQACRQDEQPFLVGGAEIYRGGLPWVGEIYLTRVQGVIEGDTFLPEIDWQEWEEISRQDFSADERNERPFSLIHYRRRQG